MSNITLNDPLVWITLINHGYINYTKNFLESMKLFNSTFKLIIYCIDQESINELKNYDNCTCILADFLNSNNLLTNFSEWLSLNYKRICFSKLDVILYTLKKLNLVKAIGYIDMDIIVLKDPTNIILELMKQNENITIFAQCNEVYKNCNGICSNKFNCSNICSGIIVFRNSIDIFDIFKYNENDIIKFTGDQAFLHFNIRKYKIPTMTISKNIFLNGTYPELNKEKVIISEEISLIHFNYIIGKNKEKYMREKNFWFLN